MPDILPRGEESFAYLTCIARMVSSPHEAAGATRVYSTFLTAPCEAQVHSPQLRA